MTKTFNNAEEARAILYDMGIALNRLPWNNDLDKFYDNLIPMVSDLSKLEVYTRRTPPRSRYHIEYNKKKQELYAAIQYLDTLILMARLMS